MRLDVNVGRCKILFKTRNREFYLNFEGNARVFRTGHSEGWFWNRKMIYSEPFIKELVKAEKYAEKYIYKAKECGGLIFDNTWFNFESFRRIQIVDIEDWDLSIIVKDWSFYDLC